MKYEAVVIGTSAGGIDALKAVLTRMKKPSRVPIVIVQHLSPKFESHLPAILTEHTGHFVVEVNEKESLKPGIVYVAPPNYHVLIEKDLTFTLTVDKRVSYARPSIDLLFDTASDTFADKLIGVILTGANHDGAEGFKLLIENGGYGIVQDPQMAYATEMPLAASRYAEKNNIKDINKIGTLIDRLLLLK